MYVFINVIFYFIFFFFFNDTATPEIYTLSLHDALPISLSPRPLAFCTELPRPRRPSNREQPGFPRSEEHTSELQSRRDLVCRLLLEKKKIRSRYIGNYKKIKNRIRTK